MPTRKGRYWRIIASIALVTTLACGCSGRGTKDSSGSLVIEQGQIAFTRATSVDEADIESDIYVTNVDGSQERNLTDTPGFDGMPAWSPDGKRVAFASDREGSWEIYAMKADGEHQRRLTNTPEDEGVPAWSPDGEKIAYVVDPLADPAIHVMDTDGSGQKRLVDGNWPTWAPDGERIAYTTYSNGERLAVMNADGSKQRSLGGSLVRSLTGTADAYEAAWSPKGKRIAFVSSRGPNNEEVYLMNTDGSGRTRLTDIPGNDHWPPTWSPDSTRIAFTSDGIEEHSQIYVMNSDGSGLTRLTDNPADDSFPAWRP